MSSSQMDSLASTATASASLDGDIRFRAYAALVALGLVAVLAVCFWHIYRLTVSARPQDMLPIASASAAGQWDVSALPVFLQVGGGGGVGEVECAVCLAEVRDGERGRLLPRCGHRFHVECIDRWFRANSTCPLCRAAAVGEPGAVEVHKGAAVAVGVVPAVVVQG
ncbi:hypothetical protein ABZP36_018371 [Zizania latifolia]